MSDTMSGYPCCGEDHFCPQHIQQLQEDQKWKLRDLAARRELGNTLFDRRTVVM